MHSFEVSMGYESVDQTTFSTWSAIALHWKCTSVNAFIPNETSKECIQFLNQIINLCILNVSLGEIVLVFVWPNGIVWLFSYMFN
jgi:hypothetical protein